jgi:hypothetical protein
VAAQRSSPAGTGPGNTAPIERGWLAAPSRYLAAGSTAGSCLSESRDDGLDPLTDLLRRFDDGEGNAADTPEFGRRAPVFAPVRQARTGDSSLPKRLASGPM